MSKTANNASKHFISLKMEKILHQQAYYEIRLWKQLYFIHHMLIIVTVEFVLQGTQ